MISVILGLLTGGVICVIGLIFEEWSSKMPGTASLPIVYAGMLIRSMLGIFMFITIVFAFNNIQLKYYLPVFSIMICIIHPLVIYIKQNRK